MPNITQTILNAIPDDIEPGQEDMGFGKIQQRLIRLKIQSVVVQLKKWQQEHGASMWPVRFEMVMGEREVYVSPQGFSWTQQAVPPADQVKTDDALESLLKIMKEECKHEADEFLEDFVNSMNRKSWDMEHFDEALLSNVEAYIPDFETWWARFEALEKAGALEEATPTFISNRPSPRL